MHEPMVDVITVGTPDGAGAGVRRQAQPAGRDGKKMHEVGGDDGGHGEDVLDHGGGGNNEEDMEGRERPQCKLIQV